MLFLTGGLITLNGGFHRGNPEKIMGTYIIILVNFITTSHRDRTLESWFILGNSSPNGQDSGQWNIIWFNYPVICMTRFFEWQNVAPFRMIHRKWWIHRGDLWFFLGDFSKSKVRFKIDRRRHCGGTRWFRILELDIGDFLMFFFFYATMTEQTDII